MTGGLFRVLAGGVAALTCAQSASAADGAPSISATQARAVSVKFAACVASKRMLKPVAVRFLLLGRKTDGQRLASNKCFVSVMIESGLGDNVDVISGRWKTQSFRNFVANGLVINDFKESGPTDFTSVPRLPEIEYGPKDFATAGELSAAQTLTRIGECAVRQNPDAVRRLALTDVGSADELSAVRNIAAVFGTCMEAGVTLSLTRELIRDYSILGYARLAYSYQSTAGTSLDSGAKN